MRLQWENKLHTLTNSALGTTRSRFCYAPSSISVERMGLRYVSLLPTVVPDLRNPTITIKAILEPHELVKYMGQKI